MALPAGQVRSGGSVHDADGRRVLLGVAGGSPLQAGEVRSGGRVLDSEGREVVAVSDARIDWNSGLHSARPAPGTAGRRYYETDTGVLYVDTGTVWLALSTGQVVKAADETVNNSVALQNDDHLKFPIDANETWFVEALLITQGASVNADWKFGWTGPAGATTTWGVQGAVAGQAGMIFGAAGPVAGILASATSFATAISIAGVSGSTGVLIAGWFAAVATAGTIQLQWAQNTATVEDNKILKGSFLRLRRLV